MGDGISVSFKLQTPPEGLRKRLQAIADARNAAEDERVLELAKKQREDMPELYADDVERNIRFVFNALFSQFSGIPNNLKPGKSFTDARDFIRHLYTFICDFPCKKWSVKGVIDPARPDDENLCESTDFYHTSRHFEEGFVTRLTYHLLETMGRLARNIKAKVYSQIVDFIVECEMSYCKLEELPAELADPFLNKFRLIMQTLETEMRLCDPTELGKNFIPVVADLSEPDYNPSDIEVIGDPQAATQRSLEAALSRYKQSMEDLYPTWNGGNHMTMLEDFVKETAELADEMERGEPTADGSGIIFSYAFLSKLLQKQTYICYTKFLVEEEPGSPPSVTRVPYYKSMPETENREKALDNLKRLIRAGEKLSRKVKSATVGKWSHLLVLLKQNDDCFNLGSLLYASKARKDLADFIETLRDARVELWSELQSTGGKAPRGRGGRPTLAPKKRGPNTTYKARQLDALKKWCKGIADAKQNAREHAKACWHSCKHKEQWNLAATTPMGRAGKKHKAGWMGKGYATVGSLARAFENS